MSKILIIGVAGTFASGQDSFCKFLAENHNFLFVSTSDMVREEAMKRYGSIERPVLAKTATELRNEQGGDIFAKRCIQKYEEQADKYDGVAITGIRSLGEFKAIKAAGGVMVFTDAPLEVRYERMKSRARDDEAQVSLEEFKAREDAEASTGDTDADFNREKIRELADYKLINGTTFEDFLQKAEDLYIALSKQ